MATLSCRHSVALSPRPVALPSCLWVSDSDLSLTLCCDRIRHRHCCLITNGDAVNCHGIKLSHARSRCLHMNAL